MAPRSENKKKILILASTFPRWKEDNVPGFVLNFSAHLHASGRQSIVLAPHYSKAKKQETIKNVLIKRFQYWFTKKGQNIVYNGGALANRKKTPLYYLKVAGYVFVMFVRTVIITRKERISIINPHWLIPHGFIAVLSCYLTGAKVVVTIHGGDIFSFNSRLMRFVKIWTLKRADEVIVNSSATLEATNSIYDGREYHVIPMGIDTEHFSPYKANMATDDRLKVLFVGRLNAEKGIMYLCRAIKELVEGGSTSILLQIVGSGPEKERVEEYIQANNLGRYIEFIGWVESSDLPSYYGSADIFVGPSIVSNAGWQEAFGLVFAESLATGTPVIATKTGGIKDIVVDGENGFLVPDKDSHAVANKINLILSDRTLLTKMQTKARGYIVDNFSWNVVAEKYNSVFNNIEETQR